MYNAITTSVCWQQGWDVDGWITWLFMSLPVYLWIALSGSAHARGDLYTQILNSSYWVAAVVNLALQSTILQAHPHPLCNPGAGSPSWETHLCVHFVVMQLADYVFWRKPFGILTVLYGLFIGIAMPIVFVISGNNTLEQVLYGGLVGMGTALFTMHTVFVLLIDILPVLTARGSYLSQMGYYMHPQEQKQPNPQKQQQLTGFRDDGSYELEVVVMEAEANDAPLLPSTRLLARRA